jgi:bacterioferritin
MVELLNDVLTAELTAINQYFLHGAMLKNWGYLRLAAFERDASIDEMKHADQLVERVLFLEGLPNLQRLGKLGIGQTPREILESDLAMEQDAIKRLNVGIAAARDAGDNGTRQLFDAILKSEEEHVDWLEAQLNLMKQLGDSAYLAQQIHKDG